ncbi:hypothetical protein [Nibribacter koreensis]|uniref:hypothetical protein n=1 Tax=Nibribacter koreensis TaxID=1084519 RepID=UPI0031F03FD6
MVRFYEMMYYALYRWQLKGKVKVDNHSERLYFFLVFLNATTLFIFLNVVLRWQGLFIENPHYYCFSFGWVTGMVAVLLMNKRVAKIIATFKDSDQSGITAWLLVYTFLSFILFMAAAWRLANPAG